MPFIFVIGLPGSGKTTLLKSLKGKYNSAIILDDTLGFSNLRKLEIQGENNLVIISDPRLTNYQMFKFYVKYLSNIQDIYLFENNLDNCINNVKLRNHGDELQLVINDINNMAKGYNVDSYYIDDKKWNIHLLPVLKY